MDSLSLIFRLTKQKHHRRCRPASDRLNWICEIHLVVLNLFRNLFIVSHESESHVIVISGTWISRNEKNSKLNFLILHNVALRSIRWSFSMLFSAVIYNISNFSYNLMNLTNVSPVCLAIDHNVWLRVQQTYRSFCGKCSNSGIRHQCCCGTRVMKICAK